MQHRRLITIVMVAALLAGTAQPASARLIAYTINFTGSGSLAGQPFTNRPVKLAYLGDTRLMTVEPGADGDVIAQIIAAGSVIAGLGFVIAAFFKFHQHKQNPQGLTVERSTPSASGIELSGRRINSYRLGRERSSIEATISGTLPLNLPVLTETGTSTLRITSFGNGRATFEANFAE